MADSTTNEPFEHYYAEWVPDYMDKMRVLGVLGSTKEEQHRFFANNTVQAYMATQVHEHYRLVDLEQLRTALPEDREDPHEGLPHLRKMVDAFYGDYLKILADL